MTKDELFKLFQDILSYRSLAVNERRVRHRDGNTPNAADCAILSASATIGPPQQGSHVKIFVISLRTAEVRRAEAIEQMAKLRCAV